LALTLIRSSCTYSLPWPEGTRDDLRADQGGTGGCEGSWCHSRRTEASASPKSRTRVIRATADRHASNVLPIIQEVQKTGATTLREIADALNARGIATARGGRWYATSIKNVLDRVFERPSTG